LIVIVFILLYCFSGRAHLLFEQIVFLQNSNWKTQYIWVSYRECLCIVPYFIAFNLLTVVVPGLNIINFLYGTMCCYDFSNIYSDLSCLAIPTKITLWQVAFCFVDVLLIYNCTRSLYQEYGLWEWSILCMSKNSPLYISVNVQFAQYPMHTFMYLHTMLKNLNGNHLWSYIIGRYTCLCMFINTSF